MKCNCLQLLRRIGEVLGIEVNVVGGVDVYGIGVLVLFSIEKVVEVGRCVVVLRVEMCSLYSRDISVEEEGLDGWLLRVNQFVL